MKFRQTLEIEISDVSLLETLNDELEYREDLLLETLENITMETLLDIMGEDWWEEEFEYANGDKVITIIK